MKIYNETDFPTDTYVEARAKGKKLSDQSQCDTSDPDNRGRGRRQKKGKKHFDELYDGETLDSDGENGRFVNLWMK